MSKSLIYAGNGSTQIVAAEGTLLDFSNIVRRYGCNYGMEGNNVVVKGQGYFKGVITLTLGGTAAGTANIVVRANGEDIPFANATALTTTTSFENISIPFVIKNNCNCMEKAISVLVNGVAATVTNCSIVVEKE